MSSRRTERAGPRAGAMPTRRAVLLGPVLLAGCGERAALDRLAQGARGKVAGVPSGDRIMLEVGRELLLAGVQAPAPDRPFGEASRRALERLVKGRTVEALLAASETSGRPQPAHLRLVGRGGDWVQGALLDGGDVWVRTAADDRALAAEMLAREAMARSARRGLWALPDYGVRLADELEPGERGFRLVEGRVARAGRGASSLYLDLVSEWRSSTSIRIPSSALRDFRSAGLDPLTLEGRLVRARGVVGWSERGPVLTLDHPEALELLNDRQPSPATGR